MTEIVIVNQRSRQAFAEPLEQHHKLRHNVFVDELGWEDIRRPDGRDVDAYDDEHSTYLLATDAGRVVAGQRLRPTTVPHMLGEVFPHLAQVGVPRAPDIWEWTRYFVVRERRTGRTDCRMLAAVQEFCLDRGITRLTAVVGMWWLPRWHQVGFSTKPLGLPQMVAGQPTIAVMVHISEESLASVRRFAGLKGPLRTQPAWQHETAHGELLRTSMH